MNKRTMESEKRKKREVNPRQTANIFSKITFWYTQKISRKGFRKELVEEDLYEVLPEYDTCTLGDRMESQWNLIKDETRFPMYLVLWNMFGKYYILLGLSRVISIILNVIRPILVGNLVYYFTPGQTSSTKLHAYLYAILLIGIHVIEVVYKQNYYFLAESIAIKVRTAVCSLIYRKCLKLPAFRNISFGKITNLITRDINEFDKFFMMFNDGWIGLISIVIICYNMYQKIGLAVMVVLAALILFIPLQVITSVWVASLKIDTSNKTDIRIGVLQETLSSIRSTKMYVWEKFQTRRISEARKKEMDILLKMYAVHFVMVVAAIIIYNVSFYLVLMTYVWLGHTMTPEIMYFVAGSFLIVGQSLTVFIPYGIFYFSQVLAAIKRLQVGIQSLEVDSEVTNDVGDVKEPRIQMRNVTVSVANKSVLQNISLEIGKGLTLVTGHSCSGKSVFLLTILKEFQVYTGELSTAGSISYVSQEPWLFPSTIRQNILFGSKYEEKRYRDVINACALQLDLDLLENGDCTIVADRGINLSKGQQSRINLARALYRDTDIYLLDDCFSSLDPLVAQYIFIKCILRFLNDKIVILVTHNSHLRCYADNILTIESKVVKFCKNETGQMKSVPSADNSSENRIFTLCELQVENNELCAESKLLDARKPGYKIYEEDQKSGSVSPQVYKTYVKLGGGIRFLLIIIVIYVLTQLTLSYKDKLISTWSNLEGEIFQANETGINDTKNNCVLIERRHQILYSYTFTVIGLSFMTLIRAYILFLFAKNASINLHKRMLNSVFNAWMKFFDRTFIGNIINRFSKDLVIVDENMPSNLLHTTVIIVESVGNLILISSTDLRFLVPTVLLLTISFLLIYFFLKVGRSLKRLEASTKSPVIGYLNATLEGLPSIKAFRAQRILQEEFEKRHNIYNSASFSYLSCLKTFVLAVDVLISIFLGIVILQFLIFDEGVLPSDIGLVLSQSLIMAVSLHFATSKSIALETQMTSVERAIEYTNIESESQNGLQLEDWPTEGGISYENVYLTINNSHLLRNINVRIKPKEKVGIVGRTGAGKSSMISALFRLYEVEGKITVDGTDIKTLSLEFLRANISIIPQDPILFKATVRDNIDPHKIHQDEIIWKALQTVKFERFVSSLDEVVTDLDFTCCQKQLICLARILLKKNKIIVLDEMVENVDNETEDLINDIINEEFASCTVIKIAHRLQFVMRCDKILVIKNGEIVEYDRPDVLLRRKDSLFYKMAQTTEFGVTEADADFKN